MSTSAVLVGILAATLILSRWWSWWRAPPSLAKVPGPPAPSLFLGHALDLDRAPIGTRHNKWAREYGPTYRLSGPFWEPRLIVGDPKGLNHVLHNQDFERNASDRVALELFFGRGLFCAEGEEHKKMRKCLNVPFTNQSIQQVSHVSFDLVERLKDKRGQKLEGGSLVFDVTSEIHRLTLDAISMTMFMYDISTSNSDIPTLLHKITDSPAGKLSDIIPSAFASRFPIILRLPSPMKRWCDDLRSSLGAVARNVLSGKEAAGMHAKLLNSLSESEVAPDVAVAQVIGILFAGSEMTANVITECFYEMARNPRIQTRLRTELIEFEVAHGRKPTYEDLANSSLPYLEAVTQETMRTKAVLTELSRPAAKDTVIPLQIPLKGINVYEVEVQARTLIDIPAVDWIRAQGHVLTFGDGPKVCLGRSFALVEFKTVVSTIVRNFTFAEVEGLDLDFYHVGGNTIKPMVRGREQDGAQLPLRVSVVSD
ncbi:cytochrome P450 [Guyanagaster necrorhizus]|uniref:Cytochrome P450 n=1 Tax=Guyanagaster necrorhizus TaxID=856835 RepID=A0A9P8APY7_9AGAR|nr:cytochrome P450 [Guyanagaster necrorhizus MCA 3950]KAG7442327.1 cytochrome P450 [Guyanagaster necrorhizus MCA 3950]